MPQRPLRPYLTDFEWENARIPRNFMPQLTGFALIEACRRGLFDREARKLVAEVLARVQDRARRTRRDGEVR